MRLPRLAAPSPALEGVAADFAAIRREFEIPAEFPADVLAEAEAASAPGVGADRLDLRDVPFVTIDPAGSRDLDQALHVERSGDGHVVRYAIADVGAVVRRGGRIEEEAWRRGVTYYAPDLKVPLHPPVLSEGAASLLEGQDRAAIVFTHTLDHEGERRALRVERALVRSRRQLDYDQAQAEGLPLLEEVGRRRIALEARRGALQVDAPGQVVAADPASPGGYRLDLDTRLPVEDWNEQISLLTGFAAASLMLEAGVGLLRTMPPPDLAEIDEVRHLAVALGVPWAPADLAAALGALDPGDRRHAAVIEAARHAMGRARYTALPGDERGEDLVHAALAAPYAHVTAPLRRLADRYVLDLLVTLAAGRRPTADEVATLARLPAAMQEAEAREGRYERALIDAVEARLLEHRVGERFPAAVLAVDEGRVTLQLVDPPVRASVRADVPPRAGTVIDVLLAGVDPAARTVLLAVEGGGGQRVEQSGRAG